jgi:transposase-like protein
MGKQKRSAEDIRRMIEEFHSSGLTRREFCQRHRIAVTTLDYWRRAQLRPARAASSPWLKSARGIFLAFKTF